MEKKDTILTMHTIVLCEYEEIEKVVQDIIDKEGNISIEATIKIAEVPKLRVKNTPQRLEVEMHTRSKDIKLYPKNQ